LVKIFGLISNSNPEDIFQYFSVLSELPPHIKLRDGKQVSRTIILTKIKGEVL